MRKACKFGKANDIKVLQTSALPLGYAADDAWMKAEGGRMKLTPAVKAGAFILHPSAFTLELGAGDEI